MKMQHSRLTQHSKVYINPPSHPTFTIPTYN